MELKGPASSSWHRTPRSVSNAPQRPTETINAVLSYADQRELTFMAFWLAMTMLSPGGAPRPFWLAVMTTSIPQLSIRISSLATAQTASRTTSVSGETRLTASATGSGSESTPKENDESRRCPDKATRKYLRTCRSVYMCDCHDLVLLGPERLFDLRYTDGPAEVCVQLIDLGPVRLKAKQVQRMVIQHDERTRDVRSYAYQSAKPSPKYPALSTRAFSPGSTRLAETYIRVSR